MKTFPIILMLLGITLLGYFAAQRKAAGQLKQGRKKAHSRPQYHGYLMAFWIALPPLLFLLAWNLGNETIVTRWVVSSLPQEIRKLPESELGLFVNSFKNRAQVMTQQTSQSPSHQTSQVETDSTLLPGKEIQKEQLIHLAAQHYRHLNVLSKKIRLTAILVLAMLGAIVAWHRIRPDYQARNRVEKTVQRLMLLSASIAILTTLGIVFSVLFESLTFFSQVPITEFLFGTHWSPQTAIRIDQVGGSGSFGAIPLFAGTMLISAIALLVAVPLGLFAAIYLTEYASSRVRHIAKPIMEMLAGIPTVVYGFFAALTVAPFIRQTAESLGLSASSESALAAGLVMGIMIIPFVSSLSDDVISAVPQILRDGSLAMGATKSETIKKVVIPAALPGIVGGILLAASRAIGETMIVVMAAGLAANLTANPLDSVTTVTTQIVTLLTGDQEFDSPKTLAAFALGLGLFVTTLALNVLSLYVVRKYREQYE